METEDEKLRQRAEEVEAIFNGIQDFISVINPAFEIIDVNNAILEHMNYSKEDVLGKKCHNLFQNTNEPCTFGEFNCPLNEVIRTKKRVRRVLPRRHSDGEARHYEIDIFPIWHKDGTISKFIEISRDISSILKKEEEMTRHLEKMVEERTRQLKDTNKKLLHKDKMASLGKLAASVVHEINNPVAGVLNLTMLIKRMLTDSNSCLGDIDKIIQYLDLMESETRRTSRIVSNLLSFSRQNKIELGRVNINNLIEETLILNSNLLKINNVSVETRLDATLPHMFASADQLKQVFMNLISNAVEAMESQNKGALLIETVYLLKDNAIKIILKDNGPGIPEKDCQKIFEPFFTTKKGKGVGLGLSVAYGIIQEHDGTIEVTSKTGNGTLFEIRFPLKNSTDKSISNGRTT